VYFFLKGRGSDAIIRILKIIDYSLILITKEIEHETIGRRYNGFSD
jgi:hypothetical protein